MSSSQKRFVDLHCHSTASDGTLASADVVKLAKESGLSALSLTDHDTIAGIAEASTAAQSLGIDFIPGIELSCRYPRPGTMHLLGYGIDTTSTALAELTRILIDGRDRRNLEMIRKLNASGIPITLEDVEALAGGEVIGRPHMAAALVKKNIVSNTSEAFRVYLGTGGSAWVDKEQLTARQAIEMVHNAGGLAVLAHPTQLRKSNDAQLRAAIKDLVDMGLDGVEVIHSDHPEPFIDKLMGIAKKYNLLMTGGSDFHGGNKPFIKLGRAGRRHIPREFFDQLVSRLHVERAI
ncbi:MAG: PHP domain-containing protein [Anaerolineae bacterium]|nr:PHP domain-containing protein [Phycisphaerae bacterium]